MAVLLQAPTIAEVLRMDNRIVRAEALADYRLRLTYADGATYELDFSAEVARGGWFGELADPAMFAAVEVGERGRSIVWPNGYDNCADALRWDGELARRGLARADVE